MTDHYHVKKRTDAELVKANFKWLDSHLWLKYNRRLQRLHWLKTPDGMALPECVRENERELIRQARRILELRGFTVPAGDG